MMWPTPSRENAIDPGPCASVMKIGMPGTTRLKPPLQRVHLDVAAGVLPEQDVMLEVDRPAAVERQMEDRHELPLDAVSDSGSLTSVDRRREQLRRRGHGSTP